MVTVYLTLDTFRQDRPDVEGGNLYWLCVHPYVLRNDLEAWIATCIDGSKVTYDLPPQTHRDAPPSEGEAADEEGRIDIVPIALASNTDITVILTDSNGDDVSLNNFRATGMHLVAPENLKRENLEEGLEHSGTDVPEIEGGPFARSFNISLVQALNGGLVGERGEVLSQISNSLRLAFWGGPRRFYTGGTFEALSENIMDCPQAGDPEGVSATNIHSLVGHMVLLGKEENVETLKELSSVGIRLTHNAPDASDYTCKFDEAEQLESLKEVLYDPPATHDPSLEYDDKISSRVYVEANGNPLAHYSTAGPEGLWYQSNATALDAKSGDNEDGAPLTGVDQIQRIVVLPEPGSNIVQGVKSIVFVPYHEIEGSLSRYRRYPQKVEGEDGITPAGYIMRFRPDAKSRKALSRALKRQDDLLEGIKLYGPDGELGGAVQYLGAYDFAWDRAEQALAKEEVWLPTILYFNKDNDEAQNVRLFLPIAEADGGEISFAAELRGDRNDDDPLGPRWVFEQAEDATLPTMDFDCMQAALLSEAGNDVTGDFSDAGNTLVPGIEFRQDLEFKFAQAYSSIEGLVKASLPYAWNDDGVEISNDDIVNYNGLNVRQVMASDYNHLNNRDEIMPVYSYDGDTVGAKVMNYTFQYRFPVDHKPTVASDAHTFYRDLFASAASPREIVFDLEHTYGTVMYFNGSHSVSNALDFPLVLPPDVSVKVDDDVRQFITADYVMEGTQEFIRLKVDEKLLLTVTRDEKRDPVMVAAWQSVAEIANAQSVELIAEMLTFDFRESLKNGGKLDLGMKPVSGFEGNLEIPGFQSWCKAMMDSAAGDGEKVFDVLIQGDGTLALWQACNVMRVSLSLTRSAELVPHEDGWEFVRAQRGIKLGQEHAVEIFGEEGQAVTDVTTADGDASEESKIFDKWRTRLLQKTSVIAPADPKPAKAFQALLAGNDTGGGWIIPEGALTKDGQDLAPTLVPMGFRALARSAVLGDETSRLLRLYFDLLQNIIDLSIPSWAKGNGMVEWQSTLQGLASLQIEPLVDQCVALLHPQPREDSNVDGFVVEAVRELKNADSALSKAVRERLKRRLTANPKLFSDAKAFGYMRLAGDGAGEGLSQDFYQYGLKLDIGKQLNEKTLSGLYSSALQGVHDTSWLGILEFLDDRDFDNLFHVTDLSLGRFEAVVENMRGDMGVEDRPPEYVPPIDVKEIHLPGGTQALPASETLLASDKIGVHLASRRSLSAVTPINPAHGDVMQNPGWQDNLPSGGIALEAFLRGDFSEEAQDGKRVVLMAHSNTQRVRSDRLDDRVVSAIFAVRGDEESETSVEEALLNDTFHVSTSDKGPEERRSTHDDTSTGPTEVVKKLFADLAKVQGSTAGVEEPENATTAEATSFVIESLTGADVGLERINGLPFARFSKNEDEKPIIIAHDRSGDLYDPSASPELLEFGLFSVVDEAVGDGDLKSKPYSFYLVVNIELSVWRPVYIGMLQGRNMHGFLKNMPPEQLFAPEFSLLGHKTTAEIPFSKRHDEDLLDGSVVTLESREFSVTGLIEQCLVNEGRLPAGDAGAPPNWMTHAVTITVSRHQVIPLTGVYLDEDENERSDIKQEFFGAGMPLLTNEFTLGTNGLIDSGHLHTWFDEKYDEFLVDFLWRSGSVQVLGIKNLRLKIKSL